MRNLTLKTHLAAPALCLLLLAGVLAMNQARLTPADAAPYHRHVREAIDAVPYAIGDWVGRDVEVPASAVELLRPNRILARRYVHTVTGQQATLLLVHTADARDLMGHYPPVCYPSQGWSVLGHTDTDFAATLGPAVCRNYRFERGGLGKVSHLNVANLMILPTGRFDTTMDSVNQVANSYAVRHFGAAQLQLVLDGSASAEQRDAIWQTFYEACEPALRAITQGPQNAEAQP